jgi:hypothetical protein
MQVKGLSSVSTISERRRQAGDRLCPAHHGTTVYVDGGYHIFGWRQARPCCTAAPGLDIVCPQLALLVVFTAVFLGIALIRFRKAIVSM